MYQRVKKHWETVRKHTSIWRQYLVAKFKNVQHLFMGWHIGMDYDCMDHIPTLTCHANSRTQNRNPTIPHPTTDLRSHFQSAPWPYSLGMVTVWPLRSKKNHKVNFMNTAIMQTEQNTKYRKQKAVAHSQCIINLSANISQM